MTGGVDEVPPLVVGIYGASIAIVGGAVERIHIKAPLGDDALFSVTQVLGIADEEFQVSLAVGDDRRYGWQGECRRAIDTTERRPTTNCDTQEKKKSIFWPLVGRSRSVKSNKHGPVENLRGGQRI